MDSERPVTGEQLNDGPPTTPRQSAAVILVRDAAPPMHRDAAAREGASAAGGPPAPAGSSFELLLVQRNPAQRFMGGYWVFPGGAVDAHEGEGDAAHRLAAVRELREEASVGGVAPDQLEKFSRWITPELLRIRFDAHFFVARAPAGTHARCDGRECVDERWDTPRALLDDYASGELALAFPTLRLIEQLSAFTGADALLEFARTHEVQPVRPRAVQTGEIARLYLPGEPGYDG
jgi:8-oxo-dGTP pyrophosphatase MutT (NUDIX family)